jgi:hypothetical protein
MSNQASTTARLVGAVLQWRLQSAEWEPVEELLADLDEALDREDWSSAQLAVTELVLIGPRRTSRGLDDGLERRPPSDSARDVVNRLLHRLGRPPRPEDPPVDGDTTAGRPSGGGDDA